MFSGGGGGNGETGIPALCKTPDDLVPPESGDPMDSKINQNEIFRKAEFFNTLKYR